MTQQIGQAEEVRELSLLAPPRVRAVEAPVADEVWELPSGTAWVFLGEGNPGLVRPVVLADGFNTGPSDLAETWPKVAALADTLRRSGRDLVIVGYRERSASILDNAENASAAVARTIAQRLGNARLLVGGFSMGGLVTRYALAGMEYEGIDHQTAVHLSLDTPHRGAWVPLGLQALAHFLKEELGPPFDYLSNQINSPASRQALWRHIPTSDERPAVDPLRTEFLDRLDHLGGWPRIPRNLGVANGAGDGAGNGVPPGVEAIIVNGGALAGTRVLTQAAGDHRLVAALRLRRERGPRVERDVYTSELPELDGAPGGTLESFGIAGNVLNLISPPTDIRYRQVCFVPSVSAVAIRDLDDQKDVYSDISDLPYEDSELDDFVVSPVNTEHSAVTPELARWIVDRLPG